MLQIVHFVVEVFLSFREAKFDNRLFHAERGPLSLICQRDLLCFYPFYHFVSINKVGCVFPMVNWHEFNTGQYRADETVPVGFCFSFSFDNFESFHLPFDQLPIFE